MDRAPEGVAQARTHPRDASGIAPVLGTALGAGLLLAALLVLAVSWGFGVADPPGIAGALRWVAGALGVAGAALPALARRERIERIDVDRDGLLWVKGERRVRLEWDDVRTFRERVLPGYEMVDEQGKRVVVSTGLRDSGRLLERILEELEVRAAPRRSARGLPNGDEAVVFEGRRPFPPVLVVPAVVGTIVGVVAAVVVGWADPMAALAIPFAVIYGAFFSLMGSGDIRVTGTALHYRRQLVERRVALDRIAGVEVESLDDLDGSVVVVSLTDGEVVHLHPPPGALLELADVLHRAAERARRQLPPGADGGVG